MGREVCGETEPDREMRREMERETETERDRETERCETLGRQGINLNHQLRGDKRVLFKQSKTATLLSQ